MQTIGPQFACQFGIVIDDDECSMPVRQGNDLGRESPALCGRQLLVADLDQQRFAGVVQRALQMR
jgi:hypothetical protein